MKRAKIKTGPSRPESPGLPGDGLANGGPGLNREKKRERQRRQRAAKRRREALSHAIVFILNQEGASLGETVDAIKKAMVLDALEHNRWLLLPAGKELKATYGVITSLFKKFGLKGRRTAFQKTVREQQSVVSKMAATSPGHILFGELGRLEHDPATDTLRCHFCGEGFRNLAQHARRFHGLSAADYRELAGLNRGTRLISQGVRENLREVTAPLYERLRAEGRMRRWDEDPALLAKSKAAAVAVTKRGLRPEGRQRRRENWEANEARKAKLSERTRRMNQERAQAKSPREIREKRCALCQAVLPEAMHRFRYCPSCKPEAVRQWRERSRLKARKA